MLEAGGSEEAGASLDVDTCDVGSHRAASCAALYILRPW